MGGVGLRTLDKDWSLKGLFEEETSMAFLGTGARVVFFNLHIFS